MYTIRVGVMYLSTLIPEVTLVTYREEINRQCIFPDPAHAEGVIHMMDHTEKYTTDLIDVVHYSNATAKYKSCSIDHSGRKESVNWRAGSNKDRCSTCRIMAPSVPLLKFGNKISVCPFCIQRMNEESSLKLNEITQEVKDDYFALLVCNNLGPVADTLIDDLMDDIPF